MFLRHDLQNIFTIFLLLGYALTRIYENDEESAPCVIMGDRFPDLNIDIGILYEH